MAEIKAVIFDMDGVLVNSTKYIWKSFNILLKEEGVHFSDDDIKKYLGHSLRDDLALWKKEYKIKDYNLEEFSRKAGEMELGFMKKELKDNKNLMELLKLLKKDSIKLAVATSSLRWRAEKILDLLKIKGYFDVIVTAEDVKNHKPSPEIFLEAAKRLKVNPEYCVVIEDAANGIEAAKAGKMKAIAFLTPYHTKQELSKADLIISDFKELNLEKLEKI